MAARITKAEADVAFAGAEFTPAARLTHLGADVIAAGAEFTPKVRLTHVSIDFLRPVRDRIGWPLAPGSPLLSAPVRRRPL